MLARIPSRLLSEWMAFARLEPFGEGRADLRTGIVAATVANVHRAHGERALKAEDFMPDFEAEAEAEDQPEDWERLLSRVEMLNAAFGGRDLRH